MIKAYQNIESNEVYANHYLYNEYKQIPLEKRLCLAALARKWQNTGPLENKQVLLNGHLTLSTLILIDILLLSKAKVTVTNTPELSVQTQQLQLLAQAGILYIPSHALSKEKNKFDIIFDCAAGLLKDVIPTIGMVELTKTDPALYQNINFPVISVDDSKLKSIETFAGTGDGFVRALKQHQKSFIQYQIGEYEKLLQSESENYKSLDLSEINTTDSDEEIKNKQNQTENELALIYQRMMFFESEIKNKVTYLEKIDIELFTKNIYVIFGYGKVGRGIAYSLLMKKSEVLAPHVKPLQIIIIDIQADACEQAKKDGYMALQLSDENNIDLIKSYLKEAFCVVTATGKINCISHYFDAKDFPITTLKINMGTPDEWGYKFKTSEILNLKKPFNFILEYPTDVAFLDPIFTALLEAGADLNINKYQPGLIPLTESIDKKILQLWKHNYPKLANCLSDIQYINTARYKENYLNQLGKMKAKIFSFNKNSRKIKKGKDILFATDTNTN